MDPVVGSPRGRVSPDHMPQLDGLRAVAVLAVVFAHSVDVNLPLLRDAGLDGVNLFFVLSGFLITGILLRARSDAFERHASRRDVARAFYARRFLRIFPLYYLILFVGAWIGVRDIRSTFFWDVSYLPNYYFAIHGTWRSFAVPLWSLGVEEQFYLVWPFLVLLVPRRRLPLTLALLIASAPLIRLALALETGNEATTLTPTPACVDALGLGALLAYLWMLGADGARLRLVWGRAALAAGVVLLGLGLLVQGHAGTVTRLALDRTAVSLIAFWLVDRAAAGLAGVPGRVLEWRPLVWIGTVSYGIYLCHNFVSPVTAIVQRATNHFLRFPQHHGARWLIYDLVASIAFASLSWVVFERPINGLKRYFPYVRPARVRLEPQHSVPTLPMAG